MQLKPFMPCSGFLGVTGGLPCASESLHAGYVDFSGPLDAPCHVATGAHRRFDGLFYEVESATGFFLERAGY
jgi:hypothetical protein